MSDPAYGSRPTDRDEPTSLLHEPPAPTSSWSAATAPTAGNAHYGTAPLPAYAPAPGYESAAAQAPTRFHGLTDTERNWAMAAHLSGFVAAFFALSFLGSLVVLLTEGRRSVFVRRHAVEALNFNLSMMIWLLISTVLIVVLIGIVLLPALGLLYLIATILGAMAASRGEEFRYPLTVRLVS
jgi:uncharacterized Tic20 family protein